MIDHVFAAFCIFYSFRNESEFCVGIFFTVDVNTRENISCNLFFVFEAGDRHFGGPQVHGGKLAAHARPLALSIQLEGVFEVK